MKITIDVDFNAIKKGLRKEREESYRTLKNAVIRDTDPYVPMSNLNHTHLKDTPGLNQICIVLFMILIMLVRFIRVLK